MRVLAVVPARMGSARMPWKNRLEIEVGVSLAQNAVDCARGSGICDYIVVSTDAPEDLPIRNAHVSKRPVDLATGTADIAAVVQHEMAVAERCLGYRFDWVVTLQPAVLARSPLIVRRLVEACASGEDCGGGLTMCPVHPWIWKMHNGGITAPWLPGPYPRSQDSPPMWQEINAIQVCRADAARAGKRWVSSLAILPLPTWSAALDVDTPDDLATARSIWPWAKLQLETWNPDIHVIPVCNTGLAK
jgi:CMP-N-acetylneuraminic acid synthetase